MKAEELKRGTVVEILKKNKKAQEAFARLGKTDDWRTLKLFVAEIREALLEDSLNLEKISDLKRYKYLTKGYQSIALLPELVDVIKSMEKEDKELKHQKELDKKRRKFNPGVFMREVIKQERK